MKKFFSISVMYLFVAFSTFLTSCHKEVFISPQNKTDITERVNAWLDQQKSTAQPRKAAGIELLKKNLDFSGLKYEQFGKDDQLIIIPIKNDFKVQKNIEANSLINLVLIDDKSEVIKNGRIAIYMHELGSTLNKIPDNTFYKVLNTQPIELSGIFRFLSVTGRWLHQFEYKNGKIISFGNVEQKTLDNDLTGQKSLVNRNCINWYLITTYYLDGIPVSQTSEFVGTTCEGCDDPNIQSLCPEGDSGSGGSGPTDIVTVSNESSIVEFTDDTDGPNGMAPKIRFQYNSNITRVNGIVSSAVVYPTTIANNFDSYIDRYGRNTTRSLTVFGNYQTGTIGAPTSLCFWSCFVYGRWIYTDGSPEYNRTWTNTNTALR